MTWDARKPDRPLRLAFLLLKLLLISPLGKLLLAAGRKLTAPAEGQSWFEITHLPLTLARLDPAFDGYKIAQLSDLHIGTWADRERLEQAFEQVNQLQPDLVVLTGDFVTYKPEDFAGDLVDLLSSLKTRDGCFAVLGNHDHWSNPQVVRRILEQAGVRELRNTSAAIRRGLASLHLAGVDDIMERLDDLPAVLRQLPEDGAAILLAHEPDFADQAAACRRFDLQLSGHSHGGQVHFPRLGPLVLPRYGRKYPLGLNQVDDMQVYTNRGLGTAEIEIRYRCPAEITFLTLNSNGRCPGENLIASDRRFEENNIVKPELEKKSDA